MLFIYARGSAAVLLPGATPGRVKLFLSGISTAGEAGVPLPASPADEIPAKKLNPEGVAEGSKTKVENPPQKPGRCRPATFLVNTKTIICLNKKLYNK